MNERVLADEPVTATVMPLAEAKKIPGVRGSVLARSTPTPFA